MSKKQQPAVAPAPAPPVAVQYELVGAASYAAVMPASPKRYVRGEKYTPVDQAEADYLKANSHFRAVADN